MLWKLRLLCNLIYLASNTILSCSFSFALMINLYYLISAAIAQMFNSIAELAIPTEIPAKEAKAEI